MKLSLCVAVLLHAGAALGQGSPAQLGGANWSVGGGLALFDTSSPVVLIVADGVPGGVGPTTAMLTATTAPRLNASVERRFTERNWLVTGVSASYSSTEGPDGAAGLGGGTIVSSANTSVHGLASVGVRRALILREGLPVVGSLQGGVYGGYVSNRNTSVTTVTGTPSTFTMGAAYEGWIVGGVAAIVVDGHLNDFVSLRISTNVARLSRTRVETSTTTPDPFGNSTTRKQNTTTLQASATFEPTLELRVFF